MSKIYYLTYVIGKRGAGKTTLLTHFATMQMIPPNSIYDLRKCRQEIESLQTGGWDNLSLENHVKHLVYVVDDIFTARGMGYLPRVSMELKFERLGLYDGIHEVNYLLPYAKVFVPESTSKLDSRKSTTQERPLDYLLRYLERQRKVGVQMWADAQIGDSTDKRFRYLADRLIEVLGQEHEYDNRGRLIATTWYCLEFDGMDGYERYRSTGDLTQVVQTQYTHYGNIYRCVNSFAGKEYFYNGMTGNFHTKLATYTGNNKQAMLEKCAKFPLFKQENSAGGYDSETIKF